MCSVSMVLDRWNKDPRNPAIWPWPESYRKIQIEYPKKEDTLLEQARKLVEALTKAIKFDKDNNEENCEDPEKVKLIETLLNKLRSKAQSLIESDQFYKSFEYLEVISALRSLKNKLN